MQPCFIHLESPLWLGFPDFSKNNELMPNETPTRDIYQTTRPTLPIEAVPRQKYPHQNTQVQKKDIRNTVYF